MCGFPTDGNEAGGVKVSYVVSHGLTMIKLYVDVSGKVAHELTEADTVIW